MTKKQTTAVPPAVAALVLFILLSAACKPLPPTAGRQNLAMDTPVLPTVVSEPTLKLSVETDEPAPSWTVVPVQPTQVIKERTVAVRPAIATPSDPALQALVKQAREDLARRLSIAVEQIDLLEVKAVVWPDSSMGCPQPGVAYTQVPQDGLLVRLLVGKRIYAYHSGGNRPLFLCQATTTDDSLAPPSDSDNS